MNCYPYFTKGEIKKSKLWKQSINTKLHNKGGYNSGAV